VKIHTALVALIVAVTSRPGLAAQQNIYQRPTSVTAIITGSPTLRDGMFTGKGTSAICGEIPKLASLTGEDTFVIEFSGAETRGSVYSISFGSKQLVRGVVTSNLFLLNVAVVTANGGNPPLYVLNTDLKKPGESGVATLSQKGAATTLTLAGENDQKEKITLTVVCG